jgi:arginase family enzyme
MTRTFHLNLDDAWRESDLPLPAIDARDWGPRLRFSAPRREIENFYATFASRLSPFLVYGSGDFHHLTALWLRRLACLTTVVSFDNHPDWDIRPPRWSCGAWVNRALALPQIRKVSVWGCGNFECWWPRRLFGNNRAERSGQLEVHPWADGRNEKDRERRGAMTRPDWQRRFLAFVKELGSTPVYVTIDLDCLRAQEAVTNWESGRFTLADLEWALTELRNGARIVAGDLCGAYSPPIYARSKQRFAAEWDHPKLSRPAPAEIQLINTTAFRALWPLLAE